MFKLSPNDLNALIDPKSPDKLRELGGIQGLAVQLNSNTELGLTTHLDTAIDLSHTNSNSKIISTTKSALFLDRITHYGTNTIPPPKSKSLLEFMYNAIQDKTLIVLMIAAVVEIAVGIYRIVKENDAIEIVDGAAVLVAGTH
jgi:Ca2+-transporting ATPase